MLIHDQGSINAAELGNHIEILTEPTLIAGKQFASFTRVLFCENKANQLLSHRRFGNLSPCLKILIGFLKRPIWHPDHRPAVSPCCSACIDALNTPSVQEPVPMLVALVQVMVS